MEERNEKHGIIPLDLWGMAGDSRSGKIGN